MKLVGGVFLRNGIAYIRSIPSQQPPLRFSGRYTLFLSR